MMIKLTHKPDHDWAPWTAAVVVSDDGKEHVELFATAMTAERALSMLAKMPGFHALAVAA